MSLASSAGGRVPAVHIAHVGLGSNLDDPARRVLSAFDQLAALPSTRLLARSSLYRTAPVGNLDQPDFVNAVAMLETGLSPAELLRALLRVEARQGRKRGEPNAARTLDLDLLLYGDERIDTPDLKVPHPRLHQRAFVLLPLSEVSSELVVPGLGPVRDLAAGVAGQRVARIP